VECVCVLPIILEAELYTTCPGERVLVVIRLNVPLVPLRPCQEKCVPVSRKMQKAQGWSGVGTAFPHLFALDYIKTWLRPYRCASDKQIRTASQKSTMKEVPVWKFL